MTKIFSPNPQFTGIRAGIGFRNGVSEETDDPRLIAWFREHGYVIENEVTPQPVIEVPPVESQPEPESKHEPVKHTRKKK